MMSFINTRPVERAVVLNAQLTALGVQVLDLPLLELTALALDAPLQKLFQQIIHAQTIVVVSPSAVEIGMRYLTQSGLSLADLCDVSWIAVGQRTAEALQDFGIHAEVPEIENSEGMLQLQGLQQPELSCVAVWRGVGGRQFMLAHLQQRGVNILNFQLYTRACPAQAASQWLHIQQQLSQQPAQCYFVLMSSEASWLNWLSLHQSALSVCKMHYVVLGQRVAHLMRDYATQQGCLIQLVVVQHLDAAEILPAMQAGVCR